MHSNMSLRVSAAIAIPLALLSLASGTVYAQDEKNFVATECGAGRMVECGLRTTYACEWSGRWTPWYSFPYVMYVPYRECVPNTHTLLFKNSAGEDDGFPE